MSELPDHICDTGYFDRSLCPEPCGSMHSYCDTCGKRQDPCAHDDTPEVSCLGMGDHECAYDTPGAGPCETCLTAPEVPATSTERVISDVLAAHVRDMSDLPLDAIGCACGWNAKATLNEAKRNQHRAHVAAEIAKALAPEVPVDAAGREALVRALGEATNEAAHRLWLPEEMRPVADAILRSDWYRAVKSAALEEALARIRTHNGQPLSTKNLRWAATHEALCRSFIFDVLMGLADRLEDRAAAYREGGES